MTVVNQQHCLEESEQWLENVDGTHQVQAGGKLALQKQKKMEVFSIEYVPL